LFDPMAVPSLIDAQGNEEESAGDSSEGSVEQHGPIFRRHDIFAATHRDAVAAKNGCLFFPRARWRYATAHAL